MPCLPLIPALRSSLTRLVPGLAGVLLTLLTAVGALAQAAPGSIEGRVVNARTGEFLEGARVRLGPAGVEAFSDSGGFYQLAPVPAGPAQVSVFYTGLPSVTLQVQVTAGQPARLDVSLGGSAVQLDAFRVATSREMDASALAINEQRFASNIKNVLSTEEFGNVAEGNVAEFLKFLPGVTIDYTGGNAREISINGV
ncbi:MAG: hypothetical protein FJ397_07925, partial [Verrucomicrobia bacterium]|nr:hypothetical protein [Verrucomicrobiota bacterium]